MKLERVEILGSPYIGVFAFTNNKVAVVPPGLDRGTRKVFEEVLNVDVVEATIGGTRLVGVFLAGNDKALLVSPVALPEELDSLVSQLRGSLKVEVFETKNTALGNLVAANNKGALISPLFSDREAKALEELLGVRTVRMSLVSYMAVGSVVVCNDKVAFAHPMLTEEEAERISHVLDVTTATATVNEGIGNVKIGMLMNNKGVLVGSLTTGPEILNIQSYLG